jgi:hypothetical protein
MTPTIVAVTTVAIHLSAALGSGPRVLGHVAAPDPVEPSVPQGTVEAAPASSGTTEIAGQGQFAAAAALAQETTDATELELASGGVLSTGNAFAASLTGQGRFRLRRGRHQASAQVAGNYGYGAIQRRALAWDYVPPAGSDPARTEAREVVTRVEDTTLANIQGMARYDLFFAKRWSAFAMATVRRDRFQGLDLRLNLDPGVAFHVLAEARHRLWVEAGYDFQYDRRRREAIVETRPLEPPTPLDGDLARRGPAVTQEVGLAEPTFVNHAVRTFAGYNNSLSDRVTLDTGLEYLQSVIDGRIFRLNWVNAVAVQLAGRVGVAATFTLRYENRPLPNVQKLDTITAILLTMRFL